MTSMQNTSPDGLDVKQLIAALDAYRRGDFAARMPGDLIGLSVKVADIMNEMIRIVGAVAEGDLSQSVLMEIDALKLQGQFLKSAQIVNTMVAREVGTEGKLGGQAEVAGVSGTWNDLPDSLDGMASNLTTQVRNIADLTTAVAKGDLGKKITVEEDHFVLSTEAPVNYAMPSIDVLFETTAESFGPRVIGVLLTGTGTDGALGLAGIERRGGAVLIESPQTAFAQGTPEAAIAATQDATELKLEEIGPMLVKLEQEAG